MNIIDTITTTVDDDNSLRVSIVKKVCQPMIPKITNVLVQMLFLYIYIYIYICIRSNKKNSMMLYFGGRGRILVGRNTRGGNVNVHDSTYQILLAWLCGNAR